MNQIVRRKAGDFKGPKPEILAPAGQRDSFLAALAAGADAIYCGLKTFSARMAAKNFPPEELAAFCHCLGLQVDMAGSVAAGLTRARQLAGKDDLILVSGSLFTVGEARATLLDRPFQGIRG